MRKSAHFANPAQTSRHGFGPVRFTAKQGSLWWKSQLRFAMHGIERRKKDIDLALVDFRGGFSYTETRTNHYTNFRYTGSHVNFRVYDGEHAEKLNWGYSYDRKSDDSTGWLTDFSDFLSDRLREYVWAKSRSSFAAGHSLDFGSIQLSLTDGISSRGKSYHWNSIHRIHCESGKFSVLGLTNPRSSSRTRELFSCQLGEIRNVPIVLALVSNYVDISGRPPSWHERWFGI